MKKDIKQLLVALYPVLIIDVIIFSVKVYEWYFDVNFSSYGLLPRDFKGLRGIFLSPFIHSDWTHLLNNLFSFTILSWALRFFYKSVFWNVLFLTVLMSGLWTWISARLSFHIGLSGVIYALFGFLIVSGFLRKHLQLVAISFLVILLYGSMVWGILPIKKGLSWESHLWGFVAGIILAFVYRDKTDIMVEKFDWEDEDDDNEPDFNFQNTDKENTLIPRINYEYKRKEE